MHLTRTDSITAGHGLRGQPRALGTAVGRSRAVTGANLFHGATGPAGPRAAGDVSPGAPLSIYQCSTRRGSSGRRRRSSSPGWKTNCPCAGAEPCGHRFYLYTDRLGSARWRGNDLSVIQLNFQTLILIQRKMPVGYTIDRTQSYRGPLANPQRL